MVVESPLVGCAMCGSSSTGGEISFRREVRRGLSWVSNTPLESYPLCDRCFPWASEVISMAARGEGNDSSLLGIPFPQTDALPAPGICSYCRRDQKDEAVGMDVIPNRRDLVRRSLTKLVGTIQQHRLCSACYYWTRSVLEDSSAMRGASIRRAEGPSGNWLATANYDACSHGLMKRDELVLQQTIETSGRRYSPITSHPSQPVSDPFTVYLLGGGRRGRALKAVSAMNPADRARTVVVARSDTAEDAFQALAAGAADLLVSPLSPQQIAGAFDRLRDTKAVVGRDPSTGIPRYRVDRARFGMPAHQIGVDLLKDVTIFEAVLYARRYLRGYDRVGVDDHGNLRLQVYCPDDHLPLVLNRLQTLAAERAGFRALSDTDSRQAAA